MTATRTPDEEKLAQIGAMLLATNERLEVIGHLINQLEPKQREPLMDEKFRIERDLHALQQNVDDNDTSAVADTTEAELAELDRAVNITVDRLEDEIRTTIRVKERAEKLGYTAEDETALDEKKVALWKAVIKKLLTDADHASPTLQKIAELATCITKWKERVNGLFHKIPESFSLTELTAGETCAPNLIAPLTALNEQADALGHDPLIEHTRLFSRLQWFQQQITGADDEARLDELQGKLEATEVHDTYTFPQVAAMDHEITVYEAAITALQEQHNQVRQAGIRDILARAKVQAETELAVFDDKIKALDATRQDELRRAWIAQIKPLIEKIKEWLADPELPPTSLHNAWEQIQPGLARELQKVTKTIVAASLKEQAEAAATAEKKMGEALQKFADNFAPLNQEIAALKETYLKNIQATTPLDTLIVNVRQCNVKIDSILARVTKLSRELLALPQGSAEHPLTEQQVTQLGELQTQLAQALATMTTQKTALAAKLEAITTSSSPSAPVTTAITHNITLDKFYHDQYRIRDHRIQPLSLPQAIALLELGTATTARNVRQQYIAALSNSSAKPTLDDLQQQIEQCLETRYGRLAYEIIKRKERVDETGAQLLILRATSHEQEALKKLEEQLERRKLELNVFFAAAKRDMAIRLHEANGIPAKERLAMQHLRREIDTLSQDPRYTSDYVAQFARKSAVEMVEADTALSKLEVLLGGKSTPVTLTDAEPPFTGIHRSALTENLATLGTAELSASTKQRIGWAHMPSAHHGNVTHIMAGPPNTGLLKQAHNKIHPSRQAPPKTAAEYLASAICILESRIQGLGHLPNKISGGTGQPVFDRRITQAILFLCEKEGQHVVNATHYQLTPSVRRTLAEAYSTLLPEQLRRLKAKVEPTEALTASGPSTPRH